MPTRLSKQSPWFAVTPENVSNIGGCATPFPAPESETLFNITAFAGSCENNDPGPEETPAA
jgi:hypothetical protein